MLNSYAARKLQQVSGVTVCTEFKINRSYKGIESNTYWYLQNKVYVNEFKELRRNIPIKY